MSLTVNLFYQKAYCDGHTNKVAYKNSCVFGKKHFIFKEFSVWICIFKLRGQKSDHDGHTDIMDNI